MPAFSTHALNWSEMVPALSPAKTSSSLSLSPGLHSSHLIACLGSEIYTILAVFFMRVHTLQAPSSNVMSFHRRDRMSPRRRPQLHENRKARLTMSLSHGVSMSLFTSAMVRYSRTVSLGIIFSEALSFVMGLVRIIPSLTATFKEVRSSPSTLNPVLPLSCFPSFVLYPVFRKEIKPRQYGMSTSSNAISSSLYSDR